MVDVKLILNIIVKDLNYVNWLNDYENYWFILVNWCMLILSLRSFFLIWFFFCNVFLIEVRNKIIIIIMNLFLWLRIFDVFI